MTRFRLVAAVVAVIPIAALASGCGGSTTSAVETLTIAYPTSPASLDPASGDNPNRDYYDLAYDPLIVQAPDGRFKPGLAKRWEYGPGNESFTIELRPNVRFSDGEPLDANAVKTWIRHAAEFPGGLGATYFRALERIEVTGPLSLTLQFSSPTPNLELVFSQVLEMGLIGSAKAVRAKTLDKTTAGAGPYVLDQANTVIGDHYTYVPNPHYWNKDAVHWKQVVINVVENPNAALQALKTGQAQVAQAQQPTSIKAADKDDTLDYVAPPTLYMGLALLDRDGQLVKAFGDARVRQALNYAIDREAVAEVVGAGAGTPISQMSVPGDQSFDEALEDRYPYDPDRAKQLLAEAGYPNGFRLRVLAANIVGMDQLAEVLAGQLDDIGVELDLDIKQSAGGQYADALASARFPAAVIAFGKLPTALNYELLWGPNASLFNPFKSADPTLKALNDELLAAPSDEANAIARQIQGRLVEQAWFVPVVASPLVYIFRSDQVTGVNANEERAVTYAPEIRPAS